MWCNETFACRPHLSLQRETSNDNDIYETPRQTSVMDQWLWLRYCCICAVKFFQNQNKCFGAQCFCKPSQKPWAFLNFPCAVLVMAIQLSKRLFGLPWKKQESSFQKVQQRFQVFAWLPSRCQFRSTETSIRQSGRPEIWTPCGKSWLLDNFQFWTERPQLKFARVYQSCQPNHEMLCFSTKGRHGKKGQICWVQFAGKAT